MIRDPRKAAVVAIGDELLEGRYADTNSGLIARRLADLGIEVVEFRVLGDDRARLAATFWELCEKYPMVVATGGLGPTLDDVTREAAADAAGVKLVRDEGAANELREWFARRKRDFPASNLRQAEFPDGAQVMRNQNGTAPGFRVWIGGGVLAVLPGPPREAVDMLERELVPWLSATCGHGECFARANFYLVGLAESTFADRAGDWMARGANPRMGVTAHQGTLRVSLRARAATQAGAEALVAARAAEFRERFARELFSETEPQLAFALGRELVHLGVTITTAESCTGGMVAELLTEVPGISAVFREGFVTYSNDAKRARLDVGAELLERHGAVSREVAAAMAAGAARATGARIAIAVSGVAGPDGGTAEKPVGLVCFGLSVDGVVTSHEGRFPPVDRHTVRLFAAHAALELVWRALPH
ncbi:MAG: CinA family nicotinamide mononucleotide deamidase-related protein [Planctomycetes bacterium]|nr:CinA family nicotinamide mononucleotide deamidase-related protein [Planctomycetota bacterium]